MTLDKLNPFLRYANLHSYYLPPKTNNVCYDCRLFYILMGEGILVADGSEQPVNEDTVIFLPPRTRYHFRFDDPNDVKIYVVDFDLTDENCTLRESLKTDTEESFCPDKVPKYAIPEPFSKARVLKKATSVRDYVMASVDIFLQRDMFFRELSSANLKLALISIINKPREEGKESRLAERVIKYVRDNYADTALSNVTVAEHMHYHPYYLSRVMKSHTGMTLHEYITHYRLQVARNSLVTTSESVTKISEMCGFSSYTYFIKIFREKVGHSPLKYRQQNKMIGF